MKDRMHEQMTAELKQGTRTDTIVVIVAILLNLLFLGINSGAAAAVRQYEWSGLGREEISINVTAIAIMVILFVLVIVINVVVLRALSGGKERRVKLMAGLLKMYKEEGMKEYYDSSIIEKGYETRYNLFSVVVVSLGAVAILIPILVSFTGC